jgi:hypothetical protein
MKIIVASIFLCFGVANALTTSPRVDRIATSLFASVEDLVEVRVALPPKGSELGAILKVKPCLSVPSEFVEVRYSIPFGLGVEPKNSVI